MIARRALVIDPVLTYSTYFGGSGDESCSVIIGRSRSAAFGMSGGRDRRFLQHLLRGFDHLGKFPGVPAPATDPPPAHFRPRWPRLPMFS